MNEKELQELYKSLSANPKFQLGTPDEFKAMLLDPQLREQFRDAMNKQPGVQLGTKDEFESYLGLKKKVSSPVSPPSSSTPQDVRTVGEGSDRLQLDWGTGQIKKVPAISPDIMQQALEDTADVTVQDVRDKPLPSKGEVALESLRKRRLGTMDYESPATEFTSTIEAAKDEPKSPAEAAMPTFESTTGKKNPFFPDQAGYKELSALTTAISNENSEITSAIDYLDAKLKSESGFSMSDYYSKIGEFNAIQKAIEPEIQKSKLSEYEAKLNEVKSRLESPEFTKNEEFLQTYNSAIQEYNDLVGENATSEQVSVLQERIKGLQEQPEFKNIDTFISNRQEIAKEYQSIANKYNSEANKLNEKIATAQEQSDVIMQSIQEMDANPDLAEIKRLQNVYNINVEKFKSEIESGRYEYAQKFGEYLDWRQQQIDDRYKNLSGFQKAMANTGRIALKSLVKIPRDIARLSDVVEKSVGLEGEKKGLGDKVQDFYIDLGNDMLNELREPTRLQRGGFTDTAQWGDLQVDFSSDGEIISVRDKDGYVVPQMLSKEQEEEIKALPRESKFHASSFAYQTSQTLADIAVQILGTKGLSSLKVLPGITATRAGGVGLTMNPLSSGASMVIVNAGMMADDFYNEGIQNGLSEEDAARYSLGTGVAIGMLNTMMGVGAEASFLKVGKIKMPEINWSDGLKGAIGKRLFEFTKGGLGESFEEVVLERAVTALSQYAMNNLAGADFDIGALARDTNELKNEFAVSFLAGGIVDAFKNKKKPSKVTTSVMVDGSKDIPTTVAAVEAVAEAAGTPLSPAEVEEIKSELETTARAVESAPEEHKSNPEVITILTAKAKIDDEISTLKEEIKQTDDAFSQEKKDKIAELEKKSAELSIKASEEAGVKPDEKALKTSSEGVAGEEAAVPSTDVQQSEEITKSEQPQEPTITQEDVQKEETPTQEPAVEADPLMAPDVSLEGIPEEQASRKILEEGSPVQVGRAWMAEPDVVSPLDPSNPDSKRLAIRDAIRKLKFSKKSLGRKYSDKDLGRVNQRVGTKAGKGVDASEVAEELTGSLGIGEVTEEDVFDAIDTNITEGVPDVTPKKNKTKKQLADRFKELTGQDVSQEFVDEIDARRTKLQEEDEITKRYDEMLPDAPRRPQPIKGERVYKALLERFMNDPTKSEADKQAVREQGLTRERLSDEYMNELTAYEFDAAVEFLGMEQGLEVLTNEAIDLNKEFIEAQRPGTSLEQKQRAMVFASLASRILQKVAYEYTLRGQREKAAEIYEAISGIAIGGGQFNQSLSETATPEAIANRTTAKMFKDQQKVLKKMGAKGKTLMEMIESLKDEVRATRDEVRASMKASKATPVAKSQMADKKAKIKQDRSKVIGSIKQKWADMQNLGAIADPEENAKRQFELTKDVAKLIKTYVEEGIVNLQELYNAAVDALLSIGVSQDVAESITKDALMQESTLEIPGQKKGKQPSLIDVPLSGTVSKDQVDALEFKPQPKGEQQSLIPEEHKGLTSEQIEGLGSKIHPAKAKKMSKEEAEAAGFIFQPKGEQDSIEAQINEVIDNFIDGTNEKALWAELVDIGVKEETARQIEKDVKKAIADAQMKKVAKAVTKFKKELEQDNFPVKKNKFKDAEQKIIAAAKAGVIDNDTLIEAFGKYLGYTAISNADLKEMARLGKDIFDAISGETKAKLRRELDLFMDKINFKNGENTAHIVAKEFTSLTIIGALSTLGTTINVVVGSLAVALPKLLVLTVQNPLATYAAIKTFRESSSRNTIIGFRELINSWSENVAVVDLYGKGTGDKFGRKASLVEDAMLVGLSRYYEKMTKGAKNKKEAGVAALQLLGTALMQPARLGFLLPGIDAAFSHPLSEFVRFVNAYNEVAKKNGVEGVGNIRKRLGDKFIQKVAKYGKFDKASWEAARLRAEQDMADEQKMGVEHSPGFVERRAKEIIHEQVKESEIDDAMRFMKTGLLMGHPSGYLTGGLYNAYSEIMRIKETDGAFGAWAKTFSNLTIGMFLRVSMNGLNIVYNTMPGLIPTAVNGILSRVETGETMWAKRVGEREAKGYPLERQLEASGWVRKSDSEIWQDIGFQMLSNFLLMILLSDMLDRDDEGNVILDPNRHFDISLGSWGNYIEGQDKIDMKPNTIKFRYDTSKEFDDASGIGFSLALPLLGTFGIAAGLRDDLTYRPDVIKERGWAKQGMKSIYDVIVATTDISFSTIPKTFKDLTRIGQKAGSASRSGGDPLAEWGLGLGRIAMRPVKTALQPSMYRDMYVTWQDLMDAPVKQPEGILEEFSKDMILLDWMIKGVKKDEYGNIIQQSSRFRGYAENITLNFLDLKEANDYIFERPEYKLRKKHPAVMTSGDYLPPKDLKDFNKKPVSDEVKLRLANDFLDLNGKVWRDYYNELNRFKTDEYFKKAIDRLKSYAIDQAKFKNGIIEDEPDTPEDYLNELFEQENTQD